MIIDKDFYVPQNPKLLQLITVVKESIVTFINIYYLYYVSDMYFTRNADKNIFYFSHYHGFNKLN